MLSSRWRSRSSTQEYGFSRCLKRRQRVPSCARPHLTRPRPLPQSTRPHIRFHPTRPHPTRPPRPRPPSCPSTRHPSGGRRSLIHARLGRLNHDRQGARAHDGLGRVAGRDATKKERLERRQRAVAKRGGEGGTPGVGDLGVVEAEKPELLQPSSRRRRRAGRRRRRQDTKSCPDLDDNICCAHGAHTSISKCTI